MDSGERRRGLTEEEDMKKNITISPLECTEGILDFSRLLDAPAGKHGFVTARNGHFYFEDGTRARFIGFNLAARSNTPPHAVAEQLAERMARLGVNLIRLHAADAPIGDEKWSWSSCRKAPLIDYQSGSSRNLNPEGLDRFDYLIAKLEERGIYLHIDLHVARQFMPGDELEYPGGTSECLKCYGMFNERLIRLQQEFAEKLLCHVNPYTGKKLAEDPAVMTIQINNEDSAIKGTMDSDPIPAMESYRKEVRKKWNHFLMTKYGSRSHLAEAWTWDGQCALGGSEDPEKGTVEVVQGGFYQPANDPMGNWGTPDCGATAPCRYADYMEFGMQANRRYYRRMKTFLRGLGVRVPIAASNLLAGAADVYGHLDGDVMENNSYFNHPILPCSENRYTVPGPVEAVSVDPLTVQKGIGSMATTIPTLAAVASVRDKPLVITEWNEYGLHPFHSTSFISTVAYACLNDWDGLILYNYATSEDYDEPADRVVSVFDAYNDPALICQWGIMSEVFLRGLIRPAEGPVEIAYTQNDLLTLPPMHMMPLMYLTYVTGVRSVFDGNDCYERGSGSSRSAEQEGKRVAVNAGFTDCGDLEEADHGVYYAWSSYSDPMRYSVNPGRIQEKAEKADRENMHGQNMKMDAGIHLGRDLVIEDIRSLAGSGDYRLFSSILDKALKTWKVIPEGTGLTENGLISSTGEIQSDPSHSRFRVRTPFFSYFSGKPEETICLSDEISVQTTNDRITLALLPVTDAETNRTVPMKLEKAETYLITAVSDTGMDAATIEQGCAYMGFPMNQVKLDGKLYINTLEGELWVHAYSARLEMLSPSGKILWRSDGVSRRGKICFELDGSIPSCQYRLVLTREEQ